MLQVLTSRTLAHRCRWGRPPHLFCSSQPHRPSQGTSGSLRRVLHDSGHSADWLPVHRFGFCPSNIPMTGSGAASLRRSLTGSKDLTCFCSVTRVRPAPIGPVWLSGTTASRARPRVSIGETPGEQPLDQRREKCRRLVKLLFDPNMPAQAAACRGDRPSRPCASASRNGTVPPTTSRSRRIAQVSSATTSRSRPPGSRFNKS